jgi:tetratricopeptide (TPR) repeat protein
MSLLLDALKPSESSSAESGESHAEDQEEALDARATLELLVPDPKQMAPEALSLAPVSEAATVAPAPAVYVRAPAAAAREPAAAARDPAAAAREPAASSPGNRATTANAASQPTSKFSLALMMLIVLGGVGLAVKLLWPKSYVVTYPESGESTPQAATGPQPGPVSLHAVQVPPTRPADRFAYVGGAPEIDLHETNAPPAAVPKPAPLPAESTPPPHRPAATAAFSVTRTEGESAIYRHVKAGYQALASGNVVSAQREYLAALEIDANSIDALLGAAAAAARDGKPAVASAAYAKVLKLEPGNPDATAAIAMLNHDAAAGEYNESHLKILIASDDGSRPALHAALGGVYAADRRWSEAAQEYFSALAKDPGNPDLAFDVAASLDQNRNAVMALNFYQQALGFARQRPAQFDVHAVEERVSRLQAKAGAAHADAASGAEAR